MSSAVNDDDVRPVYLDDPDALLYALVAAVNTDDLTMTITLAIKGVVVTGKLVSRDDWLTAMEAQLEGPAKGLAQGLRAGLDGADLTPTGQVDPDAPPQPTYRWLHLINARYSFGDHLVPSRPGMVWRGRLTDVSGWSLGSFQHN